MKFLRGPHHRPKLPYIRAMTLSRRTLLAALPGTLLMTRIAQGAVSRRLTILHVNDIHSRHEPVDSRSLSCRPGARPDCFGGTARLATALFAERAAAETAGRDVMLLDAGDQFQGSLFFTAWHGEVERAVMHAFGTEVMTPGNHEFDNGPKTLAAFIKDANFKVVSANIDASADPDLAGLLLPHLILDRAGTKIGLVGATTLQTITGSSPGPHIRFTDPATALAREAANCRAKGAQLVVALSHLGVAQDTALAGNVAGVDVFIGGHSHTLLSDREPESGGPAHAVITGASGRAVVVQAGCFARYFGRLDLDLDDQGHIVTVGGDVRHVGLELPEHPGVAGIIAGYAAELDTVRRRVIGQSNTAIGIGTCRIGECALGSFVAETILAAVHGADVAMFNGGGLRTGLPEGAITIGDVLTMLPFGNTVASVQVTGEQLFAALANGVSRVGTGGFPQIAGMRITWNPFAPPDQRLRKVEIRQADGNFAPLEAARLYLVATNNFIRAGGDGYTSLRDGQNAYDNGPGVDEVLEDAITKIGVLTVLADGRILIE
jgi:5'-nucleotidase